MKKNLIKEVKPGSLGQELGLEAGDELLSINGKPVEDIIDFLFLMAEEEVLLEVKKADGDLWTIETDKDYDEDLGVTFTNPLLDEAKRCSNQCVFCFVDQMPQGMRNSLYFKDDDSRLSFMQGNFVTLTNVTYDQLRRIVSYRIHPINVSVHATDPATRVALLKNRHAGDILDKLKFLRDGDIHMNGQVVLVPGINDKEVLDQTIHDLAQLYPQMNSLAVVPVGLSKFRQGLADLRGFTQEESQELLAQLRTWQDRLQQEIGTRFVFAADEFYVQAKEQIPSSSFYEGYVQEENGVGLLRKFEDEVMRALPKDALTRTRASGGYLVTGESAASFMEELLDQIKEKLPIALELVVVPNHFFGPNITVSGLLTGEDLIKSLGAKAKKDFLMIPEVMLNSDQLFLDDHTITSIEDALSMSVVITPVHGGAFVKKIKELL